MFEHVISRAEAVSLIRRRKKFPGELIAITCDYIETVRLRDVIELAARFARVRRVAWTDSVGRRQLSASVVKNIVRLLRDLTVAPLYVARAHAVTRQLVRSESQPRPLNFTDKISRGLYLRSDHWFNVASGGSVAHVSGVVRGLRAEGVKLKVVSSDTLTGVPDDEYFHLSRPNYSILGNVPNLPELAYSWGALPAIERIVREFRPQFVYQRLALNNLTGAIVSRRYSLPFICEYNGSIPWMARHWDRNPLFLEGLSMKIEQTVLRTADLIVVVSDASRDELLERGLPAERILVNPNGVDVGRYHPLVGGRNIRERYGLRDRVVVGFIGSFGRWHGAEILIAAAAHLVTAHPQLRSKLGILLVGDGLLRAESEIFSQKLGISDIVTFTGSVPQDEGPRYLAACDIFASPHVSNPDGSRFFGSPTKLFEYMAMGRPIIASRLEQIGSILLHEQDALLVNPDSAEDLSAAMYRLIMEPELGRRLAHSARKKAVAEFSWQVHCSKILSALQAVPRQPDRVSSAL